MKFIQAAFAGNNRFWAYFLLTFISWIIFPQMIGMIPILIFYGASFGADIQNGAVPEDQMILVFALMAFPFVLSFLSMMVFMKPIHSRPFQTLINGFERIRWTNFFKSFGMWSVLLMVNAFIGYLINPEDFVFQFDLVKFSKILILSLLLLPFQTGFEELFFRGYLFQGLSIALKKPLYSIIVCSICFAAAHGFNPEVKEFGIVPSMLQYFSLALLFGFCTYFDQGIEVAWGAHAANNILLSLFFTHKASVLQTPAIFEVLNINPWNDAIGIIICALIFFFWAKSVFKWKNIDKMLIARI